MNRRSFLNSVAAGAFAAVAADAESQPDHQFPSKAEDRIAVASYPFRDELNLKHGTMKLLDFPKMVVERFGVRGIEPLDEHFASIDAAYLAQFLSALQASRARVVNIPVGRLHGSFYDPDQAARDRAVVNAKKWIDVAKAINSPGIRTHIQGVKGVKPDVELAAGCLGKVAEYGRESNVVVSLENDDPASEEAFFLVDVIDRVKSPWLRALPDFCNSMLLNRGEDYNYRAVKAMFQRAYSISHVKEIETDEGKLFRVDVSRTFKIAADSGYRGYFSMEWDSPGDPYLGTEKLLSAARLALR